MSKCNWLVVSMLDCRFMVWDLVNVEFVERNSFYGFLFFFSTYKIYILNRIWIHFVSLQPGRREWVMKHISSFERRDTAASRIRIVSRFQHWNSHQIRALHKLQKLKVFEWEKNKFQSFTEQRHTLHTNPINFLFVKHRCSIQRPFLILFCCFADWNWRWIGCKWSQILITRASTCWIEQ